MSKFWGGADSSSDDSSSDDSSVSSSDSSRGGGGGGGGGGPSRWVMESDSESSDEERIVKSAKDRAFEAFETHVKTIRNAMKIRDFNKIQSQFDELTKAMAKGKNVINQHGGVPRFYVRLLCDLEDFVKSSLADKAAFKKLSASNGRALNRMKLTLRKHNKQYEAVMAQYRANPTVSSSESEAEESSSSESESDDSDDSDSSSDSDDSDSDDEEEDDESESDSGSESGSDDGDDDEDDSDDWASDSSSSSDSDDSDDGFGELKGRARWLKKTTTVKEKVVKDKGERAKARAEAKDAATAAKVAAEATGTITKAIIPEAQLNPSVLTRKMNEIVSSRGRRGTDSKSILRSLEGLSRLAIKFGPRVEIPILMHVVTAMFDLQRNMDDYMDTPSWNSCASYLDRIAEVLDGSDEKWTLGTLSADVVADDMLSAAAAKGGRMKAAAGAEGASGAVDAVAADENLINPETGERETADERAERQREEKEAAMSPEEFHTIPVVGSVALFMSRLDEEYNKSLQRISPHTPDYIVRLRDEAKLIDLLAKYQNYFVRIDNEADAAELAQLRIEHVYYKHDTIAEQVARSAAFYDQFGEASMLHPACITGGEAAGSDFSITHPAACAGKPSIDSIEEVDYKALMAELCSYVYTHGKDRSKTRAMLCQIFHHALHDRFFEARDLLLMSHIQEIISNSGDVETMILFNRMMVTLGMAAFRIGRIWDAHQCLSDICGGRVRELLAQGVSTGRFSDKTPEQEKAEKRRQIPYHQHINLDLIEACHLSSAMLLELPNMAAASVDGGSGGRPNRIISRNFRKHYDIYNRQVFTGPPEQTRDYIMCATKAMEKGDWEECSNLLCNLEVWNLVPGDDAVEKIGAMLVDKIKLEGLRTYLFTYSSLYDSLSLSQLCGMFKMSKTEVYSVVSKMMINRELHATWDQPTETIVLRKVEASPLQILALQFADKAANLVEANERLMDAKSGTYGYKEGEGRFGDRDRSGYRSGGRGGRGRGGSGQGGRGRGRGGGRGGSRRY